VRSCNDDGVNPYRADIEAFPVGAPTLADSQRQIRSRIAKLAQAGWATDTGAITHNGTILAKDGTQLFLYPVDPAQKNPISSISFFGACHQLPHDQTPTQPGSAADVLHELQPA